MLEKAILFLKHHWKIPAVVILLLVCTFIYRSKVASLIGMLAQTREDYKDALGKTQEANKKSLEEVSKSATLSLREHEARQKKLNRELDKLEKERDDLEEELEEDLEKLAAEIKDKF